MIEFDCNDKKDNEANIRRISMISYSKKMFHKFGFKFFLFDMIYEKISSKMKIYICI